MYLTYTTTNGTSHFFDNVSKATYEPAGTMTDFEGLPVDNPPRLTVRFGDGNNQIVTGQGHGFIMGLDGKTIGRVGST